MAIPSLISYADWLQKTNRKRWHGQSDKDRSTELAQVDMYLQSYDTKPEPQHLEGLNAALTAWTQLKTKHGQLDTMRDHKGAVSQLLDEVQLAMTLWNPVASRFAGISIGVDTYRGNRWVPDTFRGDVATALDQIASKPVGRKLLTEIGNKAKGVKKVVIEYGGMSTAAAIPVVDNLSRKKVQPVTMADERYDLQQMMANPDLVGRVVNDSLGRATFLPAAGTGAVVTFNHEDKGLDGRPAFVALAHELVHALHYLSGSCYRAANGGLQDGGNSGLMEEEMRTVGCEKFKDESPSENAIRAEHKIALRATYNAAISFANVSRTF